MITEPTALLRALPDAPTLLKLVNDAYPSASDAECANLALLWSVVCAARGDLLAYLATPADQMCVLRGRDNLAEVVDFLNGPRLAWLCGLLMIEDSGRLRSEIAKDAGLSTHGPRALIVLPSDYVERIESLGWGVES